MYSIKSIKTIEKRETRKRKIENYLKKASYLQTWMAKYNYLNEDETSKCKKVVFPFKIEKLIAVSGTIGSGTELK